MPTPIDRARLTELQRQWTVASDTMAAWLQWLDEAGSSPHSRKTLEQLIERQRHSLDRAHGLVLEMLRLPETPPAPPTRTARRQTRRPRLLGGPCKVESQEETSASL